MNSTCLTPPHCKNCYFFWLTVGGKSSNGRRLEGGEEEEGDDLDEADEQQRTSTIASLLEDQLKREELRILSDKSLVSAVNEYVDKSEKDAITE